MKKTICVLLTAVLLLGLLSGCGSQTTSQGDRLSIVTTIFPEYDWVHSHTRWSS